MRQVLFIIGCILFFWGLFIFVLGIFLCFVDLQWGWTKDINLFTYLKTGIFFVGTYLISNNKPEDK